MENSIRSRLLPDVFLTAIKTDKFKSGAITLNLLRPLSEDEAAMNALFPVILRRGTVEHPDLVSVASQLDELYGASIGAVVRKRGEVQVIGLSVEFNDDRFLPEDGLLEKVCDLMGEMLLRPVTDGEKFDDEYFESEKKNLIDLINARVNDKISYAQSRLIESMCADEAYGIDKTGSRQQAEIITNEVLYRHYLNVLETSQIEIIYVGSADSKRVENAMLSALADLPRGQIVPTGTATGHTVTEPKYVEDSMDVTQGKLSIGFRTGVTAADEDYPDMVLFNAVFGGSLNSKLFMNVREKLSLCYYASSGLEKFKGLMIVNSGVEFENYQIAKDEIFAQLEACKKGDITEEELEGARKYMLNSLRCQNDSLAAQEESALSRIIGGYDRTAAELAAQLEKLTAENVVRAANKACLDTVYFLKGVEK